MRQVSEFFDGYAASFDAIYGGETSLISRLVINPVFRKSMRLRYEQTLKSCAPADGRRILDIGCGPGHYGVSLAKQGAAKVVGIDFSPSMIEIARDHARSAGVADRCEFETLDLYDYQPPEPFDFSIVMGVMDYIEEPRRFIERVANLTTQKAFFSFPADGGLLAFQRKLRYRSRCQLFMYTRPQIERLFQGMQSNIDELARDFFVTLTVKS
jgi:SAM-dependent methyltransferase